jgi:hypothetical protein
VITKCPLRGHLDRACQTEYISLKTGQIKRAMLTGGNKTVFHMYAL